MRRGRLSLVTLSVCMVVVALGALFAGYSFGSTAGQEESPPVPIATPLIEEVQIVPAATPTIQITEPPIPTGSISIPGFDKLTVQGAKLHAESITNAVHNSCYFIVSIMLADGTEVYRSGIVSPGGSVGTVNLIKPLTPGNYDGTIAHYSCYALETMQTLNGADITFLLEVLP